MAQYSRYSTIVMVNFKQKTGCVKVDPCEAQILEIESYIKVGIAWGIANCICFVLL